MKNLTLIIFILSFVSCQAQWGSGIRGEGPMTSKSMDIGSFTGVVVATSGDVNIKKGAQSFEVEAQQNIIDNLDLEIKDDVLHIGYKKSVKSAKSVTFNIGMPDVHKLVLTGSGNMRASGFSQSESLKLAVTGSGNLETDNGGKKMNVKVTGSGNIMIAGTGGSGEFGITGSGNIKAEKLNIQNAMAKVSGSGNIHIGCTGEIEAKITGSGDIDVYGNPKVIARVTGSGSVNEH